MDLKNIKEMLLLNEAGLGFFSEAKQYESSGEFTDEFHDLLALVVKMKTIMKHPKWMEYMRASDRNLDTTVEGAARDAIRALVDLENAFMDIDREFDRANGAEGDRKMVGSPATARSLRDE